MKCLSIKQPWAELIVSGKKDIENRTWSTKFRGRILVHAGKTADVCAVSSEIELDFDNMVLGAIVGSVEIVDCVASHKSKWFEGPYGFVLRDPIRIKPSIPYRGQLRIFEVRADLLDTNQRKRIK